MSDNQTTCTQPKNGEWWVCCHTEDAERLGGAQNVPQNNRIVAYYNALGDEPEWELSGSGRFRQHWLTPIRKVEL